MKRLSVHRNEEGDVELRHIPPALAYALRELPNLLSEEFPESTARIDQDPYGDPSGEASEEWARHGRPELRHLFDSAREIVEEDLQGLSLDGFFPPLHRLFVPVDHITAWLSALAAARVGLGEVHEVTSEDLEAVGGGLLPDERRRGILLIQLLGWMQALLLGEDDEEMTGD